MSDTFRVLAGSLALEALPYHLSVLEEIRRTFTRCNGYVAYKLTRLGRVSDNDVPSFLIVTREHGIIAVDVVEERILDSLENEDVELWRTDAGRTEHARNYVLDIYHDELVSRIRNDPKLYNKRDRTLRVPISSVVTFGQNTSDEIGRIYNRFGEYSSQPVSADELSAWLAERRSDINLTEDAFSRLCSLIEGTFVYQATPASEPREPLTTRNDFIQKSLRVTFKQDDAQRVASMQLPSGPQRIRGLAGTGKTIVLSLKAALTHSRFEDFKILYLFNTQSMYQQVQSLIARYYTLQAKKAPDFEDRMQVLHAWGGRQRPGLYSRICDEFGLRPLTWTEVRGSKDALQHIYKDLIARVGDAMTPRYDLVLIDEAQDFPEEVFQVVYRLTKGDGASKRIVWAYDEFQSLRDAQMKEPSDLFGRGEDGQANIPNSALQGTYPGDIPKDFVLPNCYRTPRPVLMTAHGVAMGIYASSQNEMFYNVSDWEALGYTVRKPESLFIEENDEVEIEREDRNSKNILERLLLEEERDPDQLVRINRFENSEDQLSYIAAKVAWLVSEQEVAPEEIVIINLRSGNNKEEMLSIQRALTARSIRSVLPGYVESADIFKPKDCVTITTPFRAKGNEANIVFVVNAQGVAHDFTLRLRNAFFVALTRSRGWCYISGVGRYVDELFREVEAVRAHLPKFEFTCPSRDSVRKNKSFLGLSDKQADDYRRVTEILKNNPELRDVIKDRLEEYGSEQ